MTTAAAATKAGGKAVKSAKKEVAAAAIPATDGTVPPAPAPKKTTKKKSTAAVSTASILVDSGDGGSVGAAAVPASSSKASSSTAYVPKATAAANQSTTETINILEDEIRNVKTDVDNEEVKRIRAHYIKSKLDAMTEEEKLRFEFFMRSHLPRNKIKDIMTKTFEGTKYSLAVTDEMAIIVSSLTKLLVGELCDLGSEIMHQQHDEQSGITTEHLKESYRRMQQSGKIGRPADSHFAFSRSNFLQNWDTSFDFHDLEIAEGEDMDKFYDKLQAKQLQIQTEQEDMDESMELSPSPLYGESIMTFPTQSVSSSGKGKYDSDDDEEEGGMEEVKHTEEDIVEQDEEGDNDDWMNEDV